MYVLIVTSFLQFYSLLFLPIYITFMELYKILANLVQNPLAPRFYRELRDYYLRVGKANEAAAFDQLIEHKFGKKHDSVDNSPANSEQSGNNQADTGVDPASKR